MIINKEHDIYKKLNLKLYNDKQLVEIESGINNKLPIPLIMMYAVPEYDSSKMMIMRIHFQRLVKAK